MSRTASLATLAGAVLPLSIGFQQFAQAVPGDPMTLPGVKGRLVHPDPLRTGITPSPLPARSTRLESAARLNRFCPASPFSACIRSACAA